MLLLQVQGVAWQIPNAVPGGDTFDAKGQLTRVHVLHLASLHLVIYAH